MVNHRVVDNWTAVELKLINQKIESINEYLETPNFKLWLGDDGVLRLRVKPGTYITSEIAKQTAEPVVAIVREKHAPLLIYMDGLKGIDRDARLIYTGMSVPTPVALVGGSPIARVIGNYFILINKPARLQLRMFANEENAIKWLKGI